MEDFERISMAREDMVEWFDWHRHRVVTASELASELELMEADVELVLSEMVLFGKVEQHALGYHRVGGGTALQV